MKNRKYVTILAGICVFTTTFCGCSTTESTTEVTEQTAEGETTPAWERLAKEDEDVTFDWYINYSWYASQWGGNVVSDAITEETGVNINFVTPKGSEEEKISVMIASDDLPDIVTLGYWEDAFDEMVQKDMVYALNELADEYDPYFYNVSDPQIVSWYTNSDGNIYGYPNSSVTPQDLEETEGITSNITFLVRKDIYEAIGSPDMTTPEGFYSAVKKAAEMYPEVYGQPLIPIGCHDFDDKGCVSFDNYLMDFLAVDWERDGEAYDRFTDPDYIEWLKMFRQLGEEGYLANDIFVDSRTQMDEKIGEGRYFCMIYQYTDMADQQKALFAEDPDSAYIAVEGPRNANGDDPTLEVASVNGWTVTLISKKCKDPERAIAFLDYLISEHGQKMVYLGVEGETYEIKDGKPVVYDEVLDLMNRDRNEYVKTYGADDTYWMLQDNVMQLQWKQGATGEAMKQIEDWATKYTVYDGVYDYDFKDNSSAAAIDQKINSLWGETLPRLLLASSDEEFDQIMEQFVADREAAGYEELMEARTEYIKMAKEKLGIAGNNGEYRFINAK